jgi:hypothetical protein
MATSIALPESGKKIYRGDTIVIQMTVAQGGVAVDLTGYAIKFTAKKDIKDADGAASTIQKAIGTGVTVVNAARGEIDVTLAPSDTSGNQSEITYVWDVQLTKAGVVTTAGFGTLTISMDVTQT